MPKYRISIDGEPVTLDVELDDLSKLSVEKHFGEKFVKIDDWLVAVSRIIAIAPAEAEGWARRERYGGSA